MSFRVRSASKDEVSYAYRLSIVCLGRAVEVALPRKDIQALKDRGLSLWAKGMGLRDKWGNPRRGRPARKSQRRKPAAKSSRTANGQDATTAAE